MQKGFDAGYKLSMAVSRVFNQSRGQLAVKHHILQSEESDFEEKSQSILASENIVLQFIKENWSSEKDPQPSVMEWIGMAGQSHVLDL